MLLSKIFNNSVPMHTEGGVVTLLTVLNTLGIRSCPYYSREKPLISLFCSHVKHLLTLECKRPLNGVLAQDFYSRCVPLQLEQEELTRTVQAGDGRCTG